ncbi:hypothetical protein P3T36_001474 [Kitasatospora sp. MAP12-15]|nr:hypothetical protein [Kitasatospora sp. MAP12-44]
MAENESLIAVPQESSASATTVPAAEEGELLVPAQASAPVIEQPTAAEPAVAWGQSEGDVKPLGLITPTH